MVPMCIIYVKLKVASLIFQGTCNNKQHIIQAKIYGMQILKSNFNRLFKNQTCLQKTFKYAKLGDTGHNLWARFCA